jgi:hypothetical protein
MTNNAIQVVSKTSASVTVKVYSNHNTGPEAEDAPFSLVIFGRQAEVGGAVHFDGTTLLSASSTLGVSDSALGAMSVWIKPVDEATGVIIDGHDGPYDNENIVDWFGSSQTPPSNVRAAWTILVDNSRGSETISNSISAGTWANVLMSWDFTVTASPVVNWYINDVSVPLDFPPSGGAEVQYTTMSIWGVGADAAFTGSSVFTGDMYDLWYAPGQYVDFSIQANRRKFIDAGGSPVSLGANGNIPTGTAPAIFLHGGASTFGTNQGTAGDIFTVTGTLTDATAPP